MTERSCLPAVERCLDGSRLTLPRGCRENLGNTVAICAELVGCALVTTPELWQEMLPALQEQSSVSHHATELFRFYSASETLVSVDERGRMMIPSLHMQWAGLSPDGPAIVVALGRVVQVWAPRRLALHLNRANRDLRNLDSNILREQLSLAGGFTEES